MSTNADSSNLKIAVISAGTAIITALITAGATVYATTKSASLSAQSASVQAVAARAAAVSAADAQARSEALVPTGAVMAFQKDCPLGWLTFEGANGRFIAGANDAMPAGSAGGKSDLLFEYIGEGQYFNTGTASYRPSQNQVGVKNGDKVVHVSILPPYIALKMCVKR